MRITAKYTRLVILDAAVSRVRIHTFAEGLFSKLAHDLELGCGGLAGSIEDDRATILLPIASIVVEGVLAKGRVDTATLAESDKRDILEKMRREVFASDDGVVRIEGTRDVIRLIVPNGRSLSLPAATIDSSEGRVAVVGSFEVSMAALGAKPVKGPMGAFRVKDRVLVHFDVVFQPA